MIHLDLGDFGFLAFDRRVYVTDLAGDGDNLQVQRPAEASLPSLFWKLV